MRNSFHIHVYPETAVNMANTDTKNPLLNRLVSGFLFSLKNHWVRILLKKYFTCHPITDFLILQNQSESFLRKGA